MDQLCKVSVYLAYLASAYIGASVYYLLVTKLTSVGTPFNDTLTESQRVIKEQSAHTRRNIFIQGLGITAIGVYFMRPFKAC